MIERDDDSRGSEERTVVGSSTRGDEHWPTEENTDPRVGVGALSRLTDETDDPESDALEEAVFGAASEEGADGESLTPNEGDESEDDADFGDEDFGDGDFGDGDFGGGDSDGEGGNGEGDSNEPTIPMPLLEGTSLDRALRLLGHAGLQEPVVRLVKGERYGLVVSQAPPVGSPVSPEMTLYLEVEEDNPIRFLPEVFQEEDTQEIDSNGSDRPVNMLQNYLYIIQWGMTRLDRAVRTMHRQLTPEGASAGFLPWLLGLIPMELDASWSEDRMRQVLRDAPRLLRLRGTADGLVELIELYTGIKVRVLENAWPHRGFVIGRARVNNHAIVSTVPDSDSGFTIEILANQDVSPEQLERILRIVDAEKPVQLRASVVQAERTLPLSSGGIPIGRQFVVGKSTVAGPVISSPARLAANVTSISISEQEKFRARGGEAIAFSTE
ncbi:MAG: phage tail protein [Myxococcota bacterium]